MAVAETARLLAELGFDGRKYDAGVKKSLAATDRLDKGIGRIGKGAGQLGAGLSRAGTRIAIGIGAALGGAAKAAIDFEDAFSGVRKTVDATDAELDTLAIQFRKMATEVPIAATEFARLGEIAGALGIATDGIDEFARTTALLGVTTDLTADQAADALGRIGNILHITADDYDNFGSALVNLGNKGASTEPEIIEITKRFAAAGKQAGLTATDILGLAEAAASFTGLAPEAAGSSLSRLTGILTKVTAGGGKKFATLNKIVGEDFRKALDKDASGALLKFLKGLGKLDKYERASALKTLGLDSVYLRQLLGGLTDNIDGVTTSLDNAEEGWRGNFLNEEAAKKFDNVKSKLLLFKNGLIEAGIVVGEGFTPALGRAATKLSEFLAQDANRSALKDLGKDIGKAIDDIDWKEVLDGARSLVDVMKVALDWAKRLYDAFNLLPTPIKGAAAGFVALDKLSGGLFAGGVGNIVGGIGETIAKAGGSRLPGVGRLFAQPVFVTNWPLGGVGGAGAAAAGGGGVAGALGKAFSVAAIVTSVAAVVSEFQSQNAGTSALASDVQNTQRVFLENSPTTAELKNALAGVDQGIADLKSNPLHMLVQGDALTKLEQMRADLAAQLARSKNLNPYERTSTQKLTGIETGLTQSKSEERTSRDVLRSALERVKNETTRETARGTGIVQSAVDRSAATIRNGFSLIPPPMVSVNVDVTASTVTKNVTIQNRYGNKNTSRNTGSNGSGTFGNGGR